MGRAPRAATGNIIYHVINRANGKQKIFRKDKDYQSFEMILASAKDLYPMRILAYCLMPNHWHLILYPFQDGELSQFMQWITLTHTQRYHEHYDLVGLGHLYQGRFKSFPVQKDNHFLQLVRYVERNAKRANLVKQAEDWPWSSLNRRLFGTEQQKRSLSKWPVQPPKHYVKWVNAPQPKEELTSIHHVLTRGQPFGSSTWVTQTARRLSLESTLRAPHRPKFKGT